MHSQRRGGFYVSMGQAAHPVKFGNARGLVRHVLLNIIREELSDALFHFAVYRFTASGF